MTAALEAAGHEVLYYENTEGGHSGAANNAQAAFERAATYEFLVQTLFQ
jgi:prolyl oligopeptidase